MTKVTITEAAIRYPNGTVFVSNRHYKIIRGQAEKHTMSYDTGVQQGFVTSDGRFVSRKEAKAIAIAAGQIPNGHKGLLYSEDIFPEEGKS